MDKEWYRDFAVKQLEWESKQLEWINGRIAFYNKQIKEIRQSDKDFVDRIISNDDWFYKKYHPEYWANPKAYQSEALKDAIRFRSRYYRDRSRSKYWINHYTEVIASYN